MTDRFDLKTWSHKLTQVSIALRNMSAPLLEGGFPHWIVCSERVSVTLTDYVKQIHALDNLAKDMEEKSNEVDSRRDAITEQLLDHIMECVVTGGDHHKQWFLDQMVRTLLPNEDAYLAFVDSVFPQKTGEKWEKGTPP